MIESLATDNLSDQGITQRVGTPARKPAMRFPRGPLLIVLSAIAAFAVCVLLRGPHEKARPVRLTPVSGRANAPHSPAARRAANNPPPNLAAQRPGPPDPQAERSAAASAESAARAAAALAAQ